MPVPIDDSGWLNLDEAAAYLRTSPGALRQSVHRGSVPAYKRLGRLIFRREELDALAVRRVPAAAASAAASAPVPHAER